MRNGGVRMRWKGIEKEIERITINSTIAVSPALLSSLIPRYTIKITNWLALFLTPPSFP